MNKFFDLIKETYQGKGILGILMQWQVFEYCKNLEGVMIDLGASRNPSYYKYWEIKSSKFIKVDINKKAKPDIVADLNKPLPFENNFADTVFLLAVIYILREPQKTLKEIYRILKKGGRLFISSPLMFNESREPHDYYRFTSEGLEALLNNAGFKECKIIPMGERFTAALYLSEKIFLFKTLKLLLRIVALFLDKIYPKKLKKLHPSPIGYFVEAIK